MALLTSPPPARRKPCKFQRVYDGSEANRDGVYLDDEDRALLDSMIAEHVPEVPYRVPYRIKRTLVAAGFSISEMTVVMHMRDECCCNRGGS